MISSFIDLEKVCFKHIIKFSRFSLESLIVDMALEK